MGAQFSRFVIFSCFFVFLGDPSKIAVLPAWELNSVSIPPPKTTKKNTKKHQNCTKKHPPRVSHERGPSG
jgi:hypothetical protein